MVSTPGHHHVYFMMIQDIIACGQSDLNTKYTEKDFSLELYTLIRNKNF